MRPSTSKLGLRLVAYVLLDRLSVAGAAAPTLASRVAACNATAGWPKHHTDVVVSTPHKIFFVDNVKAGSTVIRTRLSRLTPPASWYGQYGNESISGHTACRAYHGWRHPRLTTGCFSGPALVREGFLVFAFVRAPYAKFISGSAEASAQMGHKPAAELVDRQIAVGAQVGRHVNEHFESNLYRLLGLDINGHVLPYTFVGRLEHFADDWRHVVGLIPSLSSAERAMLLAPVVRLNSRPTLQVDDGTRRQICRLPATVADMKCLGYGCEGLV